ncbi:IclR family transcriptional regulator [Stappia sp. F7233]|uniref:IclR family transcriptional regulator n=1 Tax=Stappia albiluteola TaxID=2758565 RepID=A0A839AAR0_9HYPH|nr:IclR family transcriptional regulator [Stappia albiluteola]MBA5776032.1 IclR family transcriptional regulator [Stappia albiluteola]
MPDEGQKETRDAAVKELVSPISKALHVLDLIASCPGHGRFADLLRASGFPKATLHRLLRQLEQEGMVAFDADTQRYRLGLRLIRLAHGAWEDASLAQVAGPAVEALSSELGMTVHLACLENGQVLYLDKRNRTHGVEMFSRPGRIGPAYCTGIGKAMLAFLPEEELRATLDRQAFHRHTANTLTSRAALCRELREIRERGFAYDDEEHEPSIICVAVPILSRDGRVVGGLSVTTTTKAGSLEELAAVAPRLKAVAGEISAAAEIQMLAR